MAHVRGVAEDSRGPSKNTMRNITTLVLGAATLPAAAFLLPTESEAVEAQPTVAVSYMITVTNLTPSQVFAPPVVASHSGMTSMFTPGSAASAEMAALAEEGDGSGLMTMLMSDPDVLDVAGFSGMIPPGASESLTIEFDGAHRMMSIAGMLVTTNDGFFALDSVAGMHRSDKVVLFAPVWDAGTEANSEDCAFIPGPPCGNAGAHDPAAAEGFIHLHSGIHGGASLTPAADDWGAYAARIEIIRL